ncbi:hypothetical protein NECAME_06132 [Necator americanus]|uniref:Protein kinase domain-containing protein n=1 Tax=Necator americanus TaxID=51031 RepID=W2TY69_NECAM|nr:hypothetical protein NECAME_06132 [Necator americanus]ETN85967.1 hypothetical protein NECAME_06132 [Necator americanus]
MIFPENFGEGFSAVQAKHVRHLIEWMLKPDPTERPTAEQLLRDDHVPLVDIEDKQFKKIFTQAQKTRNRLYHWMVNALGKEVLPAARAYCYDQGICKEKFTCSRDIYVARLMDELASILRMHAFVPLNTHLLVPQSKIALDSCKSMYSKPAAMVDPHGYVTMLPVQDVHPSEEWECSVDCVGLATSASTLSADLLTVVSEIPYKILPEYKCTLSIGHMSLIEAALIHAGIKNEKKEIVLESMQSRELNFSIF